MNVSECNVKDITEMYNKLSCPSNDISPSMLMRISTIENTPQPLMLAKKAPIGDEGVYTKESGLLKGESPNIMINKKTNVGVNILIEMYRKCSLNCEDIKSLSRTCYALNDYIVNSERERLIKGTLGHNTAAALSVFKELREISIDLSNVQLFGLAINPSSRRGALQVSGENIYSLHQIAGSNESSRTLEMLERAGILHRNDLWEQYYGSLGEDELINQLINEGIDDIDEWERNETSIMEVKKSIYEAVATLKSDSFIREWFLSGYSTKEEHKNCISIFGSFINCQHSDLIGKYLREIDFDGIDLTNSSLDGSVFYKCNFRGATLDGVTMSGTEIDRCNNYYKYDNIEVRRYLIDRGVEGLAE